MLRPLLVAAFAVSAAHAAPRPKGAEPVWFPTREGATRVYEIRDGDRVLTSYTDVVTKVEKKDGDLHVTVRRESEGHEPYVTTIAVTAEGLVRVTHDGRPLEKPSLLLKTPPRAGTKWESGGRYEVTKEEDVEVPAGKFKAVRVRLSDGQSESTLWFAPNVGVVKMASTQGPVVQVLKEFKPGK